MIEIVRVGDQRKRVNGRIEAVRSGRAKRFGRLVARWLSIPSLAENSQDFRGRCIQAFDRREFIMCPSETLCSLCV